ncbi:MAG: hypothetical protein Q8M57_15545 [Nitrosomonas sp.]|uniref:hypothetical protein n=1 Tax=Nitrosomonas sp. TaxID=42353 RepID=UPI002735D2C3|nr:hypothetical protein [Nitrosomonas sp.]MDP3282427.1 hypothetical protein [Nitrosomonas sp.]
MIPNNFKEWAFSLSGCDGGNIDADTWLCGIEWGGGSKGDYYTETLPKEIENGACTPKQNIYDWKDSITYPFGRSFAKLYSAIDGENVENYSKFVSKKWDGSEIFKLNLYPIAFDSTDSALWHTHRLKRITGFDEKHLFQTWCFINRFPYFSELRKEKHPKLIVCTGVSYLRDFFIFFGGNSENSAKIQYEDVSPSPGSKIENKRHFYWVHLDHSTTLFVIPFFSGSYGLNSDYLLQKTGDRIREIRAWHMHNPEVTQDYVTTL